MIKHFDLVIYKNRMPGMKKYFIFLICIISLAAMEESPRKQSLAQRIANKCALCCIGSAVVSQGVYEHDVSDERPLPALPPEAYFPPTPSRREQTIERIKRKETEQKK